MACTVENRRLFCTTSEVTFGPLFASDEEGDKFRAYVYRVHGDPRVFSHDQLVKWYESWRIGAGD